MEPAEKRQQIFQADKAEHQTKRSRSIASNRLRKKAQIVKIQFEWETVCVESTRKKRRETDINGLSGRVTSAICLDSNETQMRMWNAKKKRERNQYATLLCICTARCMCRTWIEVERVWPLSVWYAAHKRSSRDINCNSFFFVIKAI